MEEKYDDRGEPSIERAQNVRSFAHGYRPAASISQANLLQKARRAGRYISRPSETWGRNNVALFNPPSPDESAETYLYLAYGSNLAAATFLTQRGINPLSATNVMVPDLELVFDLAGIPYSEPCFANTRYRNPALAAPYISSSTTTHTPRHTSLDPEKAPLLEPHSPTSPLSPQPSPESYHYEDHWCTASALGWHKPLVGVVYEVTLEDAAHIIATEGGGWAYADVLVDCWALPPGTKTVPAGPPPNSSPIRAHTLLAPPSSLPPPTPPPPPPPLGTRRDSTEESASQPPDRRRDGWAQPSARYLGLLQTGALEHDLPPDYHQWLNSLEPFTITSRRQRAGKAVVSAVWMPIFVVLLSLATLVADADGRYPEWFAAVMAGVFRAMWASYDRVLKPAFGEGERTLAAEKGSGHSWGPNAGRKVGGGQHGEGRQILA